MNPQDNHNDFIRRMAHMAGKQKAPDQFTEKVMARITANPATDNSPLLSTGAWIAIISGLAALVIFIFAVDIPFIDTLFSSTGIQKVSMNIFSEGFFDTMTGFFRSLNLTSITWMTIAAALGLLVIERLLRKKFSRASVILTL